MRLVGFAAAAFVVAAALNGSIPTPGGLDGRANAAPPRLSAPFPLAFVADGPARYTAQAPGLGVALTPEAVSLSLVRKQARRPHRSTSAALSLRFPGASRDARLTARNRLATVFNDLVGPRSAWRTGLRAFGEVVYEGLWPGIDFVVRGRGGKLEYELVVAPGARVRDVRLAWRGARSLELDRAGDLLVGTPLGTLVDEKPRTYQRVAGRRVKVASRYVLHGDGRFGFRIGRYDRTRPLVIDPVVSSTFLGGPAAENVNDIDLDLAGNVYVTGETASAGLATGGAADGTLNGATDAYLARLNAAGSAFVWITYIGGSGLDGGFSVAVEPDGEAYVTGATNSADLATTAGAFDRTFNGGFDAFGAIVAPNGMSMPLLTYVGGSGEDVGFDAELAEDGDILIVGFTQGLGFPTTPGAFDTSFNGVIDIFVVRVEHGGGSVVWSTFVGGPGLEIAFDLELNGEEDVFVVGSAQAGFPTTQGGFDMSFNGGGLDAILFRLSSNGMQQEYGSYFGGAGRDEGFALDLRRDGAQWVVGLGGTTSSTSIAATAGVRQPAYGGGPSDGFLVTKRLPQNMTRVGYLGGTGEDVVGEVEFDGEGHLWVLLTTSSPLATTPDAIEGTLDTVDGYLAEVDEALAGLLYATYVGGTSLEEALALALDLVGDLYLGFETGSANFPVTGPDTTFGGVHDAAVLELRAESDGERRANVVGEMDDLLGDLPPVIARDLRDVVARLEAGGVPLCVAYERLIVAVAVSRTIPEEVREAMLRVLRENRPPCRTRPNPLVSRFAATLAGGRRAVTHTVRNYGTRAEIVARESQRKTRLDVTGVRLVPLGEPASARSLAGARPRVRVRKRRGANSVRAVVTGLQPGTLRFRVVAKPIAKRTPVRTSVRQRLP